MNASISSPVADGPAAAQLQRLLGYLEIDPENLSLRTEIFDLALASGDPGCAQSQTQWVLSRQPADLAWRHRLALLDMAQGQWEEAAQLLQGLIDEGQNHPVLRFNLASALAGAGRNDEALILLKPLVAEHLAELPNALALALRVLHRQVELEEGLALFAACEERRQSAEAFGVASLMAVDAGRMADAQRWSLQGLRLDPVQHESLVTAATVHIGERDGQGALRAMQVALQAHPNDGRTLSTAGMAFLLVGDFPAARDAFDRAVRFIPKHIGTWHGLGWTAIFQNDLPSAFRSFEAAITLDHNFAETHGGMAVVLALQGELTQARDAVRRASGLDPLGLSARYAQAILNGETRDQAQFLDAARSALEQHQDIHGRSLADVVLARAGTL